jgi:hypothetical protein
MDSEHDPANEPVISYVKHPTVLVERDLATFLMFR